MLLKILLALVLLWFIYSPATAFYFKFIRKEKYQAGVLQLTFDDGPDPRTSPALLDSLKRARQTAAFSVIGKKAEEYPDLVRREAAEGHQVGIHCYLHSLPLFWTPWKTRRDMQMARAAIEETGVQPSYYRPPHGWVNLTMLAVLHQWGIPLKLWTSIPGDWQEEKPWTEIYQAIVKEGERGGIICLHDANDQLYSPSKAPQHSLRAVQTYLEKKEEEV